MIKIFFIILGFYSLSNQLVFSQVSTQTIKPFKSLCISDQEAGFDWKDGKWISKKFSPEKYVLHKIDYEKSIISDKIIDRPLSCGVPKVTKLDDKFTYVTACYAIHTFGMTPAVALDAQDCIESFTNGNIDYIQCSGVGKFKPNGLFVKLPSFISMDLSNKTNKDSMSLAVGTCGVL